MQMCLGWRPQRLACSAACRGHSSSTALGIQQCPALPQQPGSTRAHPSYPPPPHLGRRGLAALALLQLLLGGHLNGVRLQGREARAMQGCCLGGHGEERGFQMRTNCQNLGWSLPRPSCCITQACNILSKNAVAYHGAPPLRWWARPCAWRLLQPLQRPSCRHPASAAWEGSSSAAD